MKYIPISKLERHQKYLDAFSAFYTEQEYISTFTHFIMDSKISPLDDDDVELFKDFLFESKFGKIHIYYFERLFNQLSDKDTFDWNVRVMAKYIEFIGKISEFYCGDIFIYLFSKINKSEHVISLLLNYLPKEDRMIMAKVAQTYPVVLTKNPKLKLYSLFS